MSILFKKLEGLVIKDLANYVRLPYLTDDKGVSSISGYFWKREKIGCLYNLLKTHENQLCVLRDEYRLVTKREGLISNEVSKQDIADRNRLALNSLLKLSLVSQTFERYKQYIDSSYQEEIDLNINPYNYLVIYVCIIISDIDSILQFNYSIDLILSLLFLLSRFLLRY